jgi:NAD(P)-dependent dehydrogenase (short-subunit alcohol dehydrogenase family)
MSFSGTVLCDIGPLNACAGGPFSAGGAAAPAALVLRVEGRDGRCRRPRPADLLGGGPQICMVGMKSGLGFSSYSASKFAVVIMSEGLAMELTPLDIGVTVLCPGFVRARNSCSRAMVASVPGLGGRSGSVVSMA